MNTDFYKRKVLEMLTDESYYKPVPDNNRKEIFDKIDNLIKNNKNLTKKEIEFLTKFDCKTSTFYGLPKYTRVKLSKIFIMSRNPNILQY